jgi:hypothetical protein
MKNFGFSLSIWQYYIVVLVLRFFAFLALAFMFSEISKWSKKQEYGLMVMILLLLPSILYLFGNENLSFAALTRLLQVSGFLRAGMKGFLKWCVLTGTAVGFAVLLKALKRQPSIIHPHTSDETAFPC